MWKQQGQRKYQHEQNHHLVHGIKSIVTFITLFGMAIWLQPVPVYAAQVVGKAYQQLPALGKEAKLSYLYLPKDTALQSGVISVSHDLDGVMMIEFQHYRLMESNHSISLDEPNEREVITELPPGVRSAMLDTYLLPGGTIQHTLSLSYAGMYVTVVPKWTSALRESGKMVPENKEAAPLRQTAQLMAVAKLLHKVELD